MYADPEKKKQRRRERHQLDKARMAVDPDFAAKKKAQDKAARARYAEKQKQKRIVETIKKDEELRKGKPGRIVALCGWMHW